MAVVLVVVLVHAMASRLSILSAPLTNHLLGSVLVQVSMESNGKGVDALGNALPVDSPEMGGEIVFGEPGTVGQHSFYQLLHLVSL